MTRGTAHAFTHDGEGRFLDYAGVLVNNFSTFLTNTQTNIQNNFQHYGDKVVNLLTPVAATVQQAGVVFSYATVAQVGISFCSLISNALLARKVGGVAEDMRVKIGEAANTFCGELPRMTRAFENMSEKIGNASSSTAKSAQKSAKAVEHCSEDIHDISNSCRYVSAAIAVAALISAELGTRSAICSSSPDSLFCLGPFLTITFVSSTGYMLWQGLMNKTPTEDQLKQVYAESAEYHEEMQASSMRLQVLRERLAPLMQ